MRDPQKIQSTKYILESYYVLRYVSSLGLHGLVDLQYMHGRRVQTRPASATLIPLWTRRSLVSFTARTRRSRPSRSGRYSSTSGIWSANDSGGEQRSRKERDTWSRAVARRGE